MSTRFYGNKTMQKNVSINGNDLNLEKNARSFLRYLSFATQTRSHVDVIPHPRELSSHYAFYCQLNTKYENILCQMRTYCQLKIIFVLFNRIKHSRVTQQRLNIS